MLIATPAAITSRATTVPIHDIGGILVVDTMINGKGPYHFVLDTGAGITVVTPELAKALHLAATGGGTAHGGTSNRSVAVRLTDLKRVSIGSAVQDQIAAAIIPLPPGLTYQGTYGTIDGVVGFSFLRKYAVSLDIAGNRASFIPSVRFSPPKTEASLPVTFTSSGIPTITARIDGGLGRFEIDSGNNDDVLLNESFAIANGVGRKYRTRVHSQTTDVGGSVGTTRVRVATISVGPFAIHGTPTDISQTQTSARSQDRLDGNIGYDVLRQLTITLDYAGARLYFQPSQQFGTNTATMGTGIVPQRNDDGTFKIVDVSPDTPASKAGVRAGETILAINGMDIRSMSMATYKAVVGKNAGTPVTYTLRTGSTQRSLTIKTVDLLPLY